jgi:hypothetical protein
MNEGGIIVPNSHEVAGAKVVEDYGQRKKCEAGSGANGQMHDLCWQKTRPLLAKERCL